MISLKSTGNSNKKIQEVLLEELKLQSQQFRCFFCNIDARRSGRKPKLRQEHVDYMDEKMKENDELTSQELKEKVAKDCDMDVSTATIRRAS